MTKVTTRGLEERAQQVGLHIGDDARVEGRMAAAVVEVPAEEHAVFELAAAILIELSMMIAVEDGQILVDGEPFTWEEVIETADELLADYAE